MSELYFISDLHLGHANCLGFDNRPFSSIEAQDNYIITEWNKKIKPDDTVWILGDISWYDAKKTVEIYSKLNGIKNLCRGNHDDKLLKDKHVRELFNEVVDYKELYLPNTKSYLILSHYPIPCFKNHFYGAIHFYGHVHSSFEWNMMERVKNEMTALYDKQCKMYNVGCMMPYMGYVPQDIYSICAKAEMFRQDMNV